MEKRQRKVLWWVAGVLGVVLVGMGTFWLLSKVAGDRGENPRDEDEIVTPETPVVVGRTGKMLLTGNIFWGRRINDKARASDLGVAYPFSGLAGIGRAGYTDWIGGLECPVTDKGGKHNYNDEYNLLKFNCDPDYLPEFAKWFSVVSLGNNHTDNQGSAGFAETVENLTEYGVQWFGHYDRGATDEICRVVAVKVWEEMSDGTVREGRLPMGFCGHHGVFGVPTEASLRRIAEYAAVMPVVAMPHMGAEYKPGSDGLRESVYRKMIEYGAELVAGDHPHWVQNAEVYKGKLIVYSMGNFMFDQDWNEDVRRSAAVSAGFTVSGAEGWDAVVDGCVEGGLEVCAELVTEAGLSRYEVKWDYEVVATETTGMVTGVASEVVRGKVMERLGWGGLTF